MYAQMGYKAPPHSDIQTTAKIHVPPPIILQFAVRSEFQMQTGFVDHHKSKRRKLIPFTPGKASNSSSLFR